MSDLDKKLREALDLMWNGGIDWATSNDFSHDKFSTSEERDATYLRYQSNLRGKIGDRIKQAFKDDGWVKLRNHEPAEKCYTGQEWYDRFARELKMYDIGMHPDDYMDDLRVSDVLEAAKKASGIE